MLAEVERLPLEISDLHDPRLPHLTNAMKYAPSTGSWPQRRARTFDPQDGRHTVFIIVCLCYEGLEWPGGGRMDVVGPKHDLLLLLSHLQYRHLDENREFLIFTDFEVDFKDHTGFTGSIRRMPATRHNIVCLKATNSKNTRLIEPVRKSTYVQATMLDLEREDKS
ncbi:hypothetical protein FS837_000877 [Tulasnella sp. UAMH 9824]|nr:hypothetical protein FS837_000877 [Tulasnella sp. UAMH 9824]